MNSRFLVVASGWITAVTLLLWEPWGEPEPVDVPGEVVPSQGGAESRDNGRHADESGASITTTPFGEQQAPSDAQPRCLAELLERIKALEAELEDIYGFLAKAENGALESHLQFQILRDYLVGSDHLSGHEVLADYIKKNGSDCKYRLRRVAHLHLTLMTLQEMVPTKDQVRDLVRLVELMIAAERAHAAWQTIVNQTVPKKYLEIMPKAEEAKSIYLGRYSEATEFCRSRFVHTFLTKIYGPQ